MMFAETQQELAFGWKDFPNALAPCINISCEFHGSMDLALRDWIEQNGECAMYATHTRTSDAQNSYPTEAKAKHDSVRWQMEARQTSTSSIRKMHPNSWTKKSWEFANKRKRIDTMVVLKFGCGPPAMHINATKTAMRWIQPQECATHGVGFGVGFHW